MYPFERIEKIIEKLRANGQIKIQEDAEKFGVSKATLHRDLDLLEKQGLVEKVRGGAILRERMKLETHFHLRFKTNVEKKRKIAAAAAKSVQDDTSIFMDHSSTVSYLAESLAANPFRNLIVVTNSLVVHTELAEAHGIQVILTGGAVEPDFQALFGRWVIESFRGFNFHQVFASCGAVTADGFMTQTPFIYEIHSEIVNSSKAEINILADSSKFHKIATFRVGPLKAAAKVYTDSPPPEALLENFKATGPQLIVVR